MTIWEFRLTKIPLLQRLCRMNCDNREHKNDAVGFTICVQKVMCSPSCSTQLNTAEQQQSHLQLRIKPPANERQIWFAEVSPQSTPTSLDWPHGSRRCFGQSKHQGAITLLSYLPHLGRITAQLLPSQWNSLLQLSERFGHCNESSVNTECNDF